MGNSFSFEPYGEYDVGNDEGNENNVNVKSKINLSSDLFKEEEEERKKYLLSIKELENKFKLSALESRKLKSHKSAILIQKVWRGHSQRKKWSLFLKKSQVIKELLITERDYVQFLKVIVNVYMVPLKELVSVKDNGGRDSTISSATNQKILKNIKNDGGQNLGLNLEQPPLSSDEIKIVFSQIEVILLYNSKLLEKLSTRITNDRWNYYQKIGDVFLEFTHFLKVPYSHYITNFPSVLKVLESASKRPSYVLFIQECKHLPQVGKRDLQSFVSMPVQRCPRYVLLLRELLKFTHSSDHDFKNIVSALQGMETIADLINRQMKEEEISREIIAINEKLTPKVKNLIEPHRRLIKEGEVKIYKADGNDHDTFTGTIRPSSIWKIQSPRFRYIYLFNDSFIVSKKTKTLYKVEQFVNLEYSTVIDHSKSIKIIETIPSDDQLNKYNVDNSCNNLENSCNNSVLNDLNNNSNNNNNINNNNNNNNNNNMNNSVSDLNNMNSNNINNANNNANSNNINNANSNNNNNGTTNRKMSFSSFIENSIKSGRESFRSSNSDGDRYYFKLHTLDCTLVICLPNEEEKEQWRSAFVNVINQVTENVLSFNPKWSTNPGLVDSNSSNNYGSGSTDGAYATNLNIASFTSPSLSRMSPYHSKLSSPMRGTLLTNDNFSLKQSIQELLSLSKPIKGMEGSSTISSNYSSSSSPNSTVSSISNSSTMINENPISKKEDSMTK
ncbi:hypothetical protein ACTFIZ_000873 [Dictyostelium cf. discoideum]